MTHELARTNVQPCAANSGDEQDDLRILRSILVGTARSTGEEFFQSLVRQLAAAIDVSFAFVTEFAEVNTRVRTLAFWFHDHIRDNFEYDLAGSPCEDVIRSGICHHPDRVQEKFQDDGLLVEWGVESYLGVPLQDDQGQVMGHLAVFDGRPMPAEPRRLFILQIFAARAAAELERLRAERCLQESEERFRDLFEEAPIAYVMEDLESKFVRANRAATTILGIDSEEVAGTVGTSLVAETSAAQRGVWEALSSIGRGEKTSGVVLELRRRDNGKPVWIQWWSKPDLGGKYTRTMFVDITDQVQAEQERNRLQQQNTYLQEEIKSVHNFEEIVGQSQSLLEALGKTRQVASTDATVLIQGETGTGKELIARALHSASLRRERPLIKVNCAALPTGLVESELFGHEKGAFTGALTKRIGRFELAHGGTIFLDEIGELPADIQAKLLRVLQEREFERVGGSVPIKVDVRVITATNRDLLKAVQAKTFREDLYYRLNVFPIRMPPLRERTGDVPLLTHFLIKKFAMRIGKQIDGIGRTTMARLTAYRWPGNVRELENVIERGVIMNEGPLLEIEAEMLAEPSAGQAAEQPGNLENLERQHIIQTLRQTGWVIEGPKGAALVLGLHPNTLRSRMKKLGISKSSHEPS
jgi:PAS domain S-box-containing protein